METKLWNNVGFLKWEHENNSLYFSEVIINEIIGDGNDRF